MFMLIIEEMLTEEYWRCENAIQAINEQLSVLPKGSIHKQAGDSEDSYYLRYLDGNKAVSEYISPEDVDDIMEKLDRRKCLLKILEDRIATQRIAVRGLGEVPHDFRANRFS